MLENGADGFVSKSSPESELVAAIKDVSGGGSHVQESLVEPLHTYKNIFMCLTKNEQTILNEILERKDIASIAGELKIPVKAVEIHISRICAKTGCHNHDELIAHFG